MYDLALSLVLFSSLGALIYLLARAVPRVHDAGDAAHVPGLFDRILVKLPLRDIDEGISRGTTKLLRRVRVGVLKLDNSIVGVLGRVKSKGAPSTDGGSSDDLFTTGGGGTKE
jgi:hypothetical protein